MFMRNLLADFADSIFERIDYTLEGLGDEELYWKPVEKSNTIYWILTHTTRIAYLLIPQVITQTYNPEGWDDDYEKQKHTLEELRHDLREGRNQVVSGIKELDTASLSEEIYIWGKNRPLKEPIFVLLRELLHHNGRIALLRGIYKRTRAD